MADPRESLLNEYGYWYGAEHFAIAFTAGIEGEAAKKVTSKGWDKTAALADGPYGQSYVSGRGLKRNLAIVLRPSNLIVLECDSEEDLVRIEALELPKTVTVRSSKPYKRHYYFRPPPELEALPYVAFRFESGKLTADTGRYFLAPPSIHPSGEVYSFLASLGPRDIDIAHLPDSVYRDLSEQARIETSELREAIADDPAAKIRAGNRRDLLFRYACMLRRWGVPQQQILEQTLAFNDARCEPPVERSLVEVQVAGAMKKDGNQELANQPEERPEEENVVRLDEHREQRQTHWDIQTWSEFRDDAADDVDFLIQDLWTEGALGFIAARPKAGKTWLALALSVALATGTPLFGEYAIPQPRNVLYVALEGARAALRARIGAIARGMGFDPDGTELDRLHVLYRPKPFNLGDEKLAPFLLAESARVDAALVVVDVLRQAMRGLKEGGAEDFATVRDRLEPLHDDGRSVALLHHFGKMNETQKERTPGERMAGSGAMEGALDVGIYITRSESGARRLRLEFEARDFATADETGIAILGEGNGRNGGFTYLDSAELVVDAGAAEGRDLVVELEEMFADGKWRTVKECASKAEGIGANIDEVRVALRDASERFISVSGPRVGRAHSAQPWGTLGMYRNLSSQLEIEVTQHPESPESPGLDDGQSSADEVQVTPRRGSITESPVPSLLGEADSESPAPRVTRTEELDFGAGSDEFEETF